MPTEAEDTVAVSNALEGIDDPEEVRRIVVSVRAMLGLREAAPPAAGVGADIPLLFAFPSDPLSSSDRELLQRARARIDDLLATQTSA